MAGAKTGRRRLAMFDDYKRECPRCAAHLGESIRCPSCHKFLPRRLSRTRRVVENTAIGVLLSGLVFAFAAPDLVRRAAELRNAKAAAKAATPPPWNGPGAEPAARAWAFSMEKDLQGVCRDALARFADRKQPVTELAAYLPAAVRARGEPLTQESLRFTEDEQKEIAGLFGERLGGECLGWTYQAIQNCEVYRTSLGTPSATSCLVGVVQRALASAPFTSCADSAKLDRVRQVCLIAAKQARQVASAR
ncbi:MAG TPA: hypothetical protein VFP52_09385 [Myxococcales bacterium]|nr:hypothetical protein [Myxococcales bacterium]